VREGWLLRRVEGAEPWNLVPQRFRAQAMWLAIVPLVLLDLMSALLGGPTGISFLAFLVVLRWSRPIADSLIRRSLAAHPPIRSLSGRRRGDPVRVRGRVRPGPCFSSAGGQWAAVLACYTGTVERERGPRRGALARSWAEVRGIDFVIDLENGESAMVGVREAYLLAPPGALSDMVSYRTGDAVTAPLGRVVRWLADEAVTESVIAELVIGPGDEVEVFGVLDWEVSPLASGAPGRGVGLSPVVRGGPRVPLVVCPRADGRA
jgi:hypothetical protein